MALSGNFSKTISGSLAYRIEWSATQSIANNKSTITCKHYLTGTGYRLNINAKSGTCNVGGSSKSFTSPAINGGVTKTLIGTTTHEVAHNADGSKSVTITGKFNIQATLSGSYIGSVSASKTVTLDTIPRAAAIKTAPNFTDEGNPVITYSNPAGNAVTSLQACISFTGARADIAYRDIPKTGTSYTFNLTDAEREVLQEGCTTTKSMTVYFYIQTVLGGSTYRSRLAKTLTIANAAPTLVCSVADGDAEAFALTGDASRYIKGYSDAAYTMEATGKKHATVKSLQLKCGSKTATAASGTLVDVDAATFTFTATDSRGYTATQTATCTLVDYSAPTCTLRAGQPTADGDLAFTISGQYAAVDFGAVENALTVQYRMAENDGDFSGWVTVEHNASSGSYTADVALSGLDYRTKYTIQARAVDKLEAAVSSARSVKAMPLFDWGEDDFSFNVPVTFNAGIVTNAPVMMHAQAMTPSAATTLTQTMAKMPMGTAYGYAGSGLFDASGGGIKCLKDGKVLVFATLHANNLTAGDSLECAIYKNGTALASYYGQSGSKTFCTCHSAPKLVTVAEGDVLYLYGRNYSGARGNVGQNTITQLMAIYVQ